MYAVWIWTYIICARIYDGYEKKQVHGSVYLHLFILIKMQTVRTVCITFVLLVYIWVSCIYDRRCIMNKYMQYNRTIGQGSCVWCENEHTENKKEEKRLVGTDWSVSVCVCTRIYANREIKFMLAFYSDDVYIMWVLHVSNSE